MYIEKTIYLYMRLVPYLVGLSIVEWAKFYMVPPMIGVFSGSIGPCTMQTDQLVRYVESFERIK